MRQLRTRSPYRRFALGGLLLGLSLAAASGCRSGPLSSTVSPEFTPTALRPHHHQLALTIDAPSDRLILHDRIEFAPAAPPPTTLAFYLSPGVTVSHILVNRRDVNATVRPARWPSGLFNERRYDALRPLTRYEVPVPSGETMETLEISYEAPYSGNDRELLLTGDSAWYPIWPDALFTFELEITQPDTWRSLSAGRRTHDTVEDGRRRTVWSMEQPTETIDLVAADYVIATRPFNGLELSIYLFPEDRHLAAEYLDAAADYLTRYTGLLGPYPFAQLAIAETRAPAGTAFPSFLLLGQSIMRRHYTQPYALGHEIVHAWIGNGVIPEPEQGNWAEALTTYLANYYAVERDNPEAALDERQQMLVHYATLAPDGRDYPLMRFLSNESQLDAAVGYQKGAFVFHMLRRMVGDDHFFDGLQEFIRRYQGRRAGWNDFRHIYEARLGAPLDWFFRQWVVRPGAPQLAIDGVDLSPLAPTEGQPAGTLVTLRVTQSSPPYRLPVMVHIETADRILEKSLWLDQTAATIETAVGTLPMRITVDPELHLFRRMVPDELAPTFNLTLSHPALQAILPTQEDAVAVYAPILTQAHTRRPDGTAPSLVTADGSDHAAALFILGGPGENQAADELAAHLPPSLRITSEAFTIDGLTYDGPGDALLLTVREPERADRLTTLFYGLTPEAVAPLRHLLYYHGWKSYLVFRHGQVIASGMLPAPRHPLIWEPVDHSTDERR